MRLIQLFTLVSAFTGGTNAGILNGGFESGDFTSWTVERGCTPGGGFTQSTPQTETNLGLVQPGTCTVTGVTAVMSAGGAGPRSQTIDSVPTSTARWPLTGNYAALINRGGKNNNYADITQVVTFTNSDFDPIDGKLHVRFALLPIIQNPSHSFNQQPYYFIAVTLNDGTVLASDLKVAGQAGVPWQSLDSGATQFLDWQLYDYTSTSFAVGSSVTLTILGAGCALGGHWGEVYVDAIDTQVTTLAVSGTASPYTTPCNDITYNLLFQNQQGSQADNVVIRFAVPTNTAFKSVSSSDATCSQSSGTVSCTVQHLSTGSHGAITVVVTVNCGAPSTPISTANYGISATGANELLGPILITAINCVPKTCQDLGFTSGLHADTCGGTVDCGASVSVQGDPQFAGLQGQNYQVHGGDNVYFNLISYTNFLMNSKFIYIGTGDCRYNHTLCWTHPGTYVSELGFRTIDPTTGSETKIGLYAGSHEQGLTVFVNLQQLMVNETSKFRLDSRTVLTYHNNEKVSIHIDNLFDITIHNSDYFFNMAISCLRHDWLRAGSHRFNMPADRLFAKSPYPDIPLHGLLGQTWKNVLYNNGHVYEGDVMDYASDFTNLYFIDFSYNKYKKGHAIAHSTHQH